MSKKTTFINALGGSYWMLSEAKLNAFQRAAISGNEIDFVALQQVRGEVINDQAGETYFRGKQARSFMRGDIAVLDIRGALVKDDDARAYFWGLQTYESLALEFTKLVQDPSVKGIILEMNTPGGEVAGAVEFAEMVFAARGSKPKGIITRAGGDLDSAGYWIGAASEKVYIDPTGTAGSIGVVATFLDTSGWEESVGLQEIEIVSTGAPNKRLDVKTPEGVAEVRKVLDKMEGVFVESVAKYRGVSTEKVRSDFGKGGIFVGQDAVDAGLADGVMSFEAALASLNPTQNTNQTPSTENIMSAEKKEGAQATSSADAVKAERERIQGINKAFAGTGFEAESDSFIDEGKTVAEAESFLFGKMKEAKAAEAAKPQEQTPKADGSLAAAMAAEGENAGKVTASGDDTDDAEALQAKVNKAFVRGANKKREEKFGAAARAGMQKARV
jgi:ClpP class serine protease